MSGVFCSKLSWNGSAEFPFRRTGSQDAVGERALTDRDLFSVFITYIFRLARSRAFNARSMIYRTNREESVMSSNYKSCSPLSRRRARCSGHARAARSSQAESLHCHRESKPAMPRPKPPIRPSCPGCAKSCRWSQFAHWRWKDCCTRREAAPKRVAITEWDSLEQAEAFYKSKAWNDLAPQRDKAVKTIRRYAVEVMN